MCVCVCVCGVCMMCLYVRVCGREILHGFDQAQVHSTIIIDAGYGAVMNYCITSSQCSAFIFAELGWLRTA